MILKTSFKMKPPVSATLRRGHLLARGLAAYWLMPEGGGSRIHDFSDNQNIGSFVADTAWALGQFGRCLTFDGAGDYVNCGSQPVLDITQELTISLWMYLFSFGSGNPGLVSRGTWTGGGYYLRHGTVTTDIFLTTSAPGSSYNSNAGFTALNTWIHAVVTFSTASGRVKFYKNGILDIDLAKSADNITTYPGPLLLAQYSGYYFNGLIDNVMIFNRALTADEISLLYRNPFCIFQRGLRPLTAAAETIVQPSALGLAAGLQVPTVIGDVTVAPSALGLAAGLQVPTVIGDLTVAPSALSLAAGLQVPTVDVTVTPSALGLAGSLQVPTVVGDVTVTPSVLELAASLLTATVVWPAAARRSHVGFKPIEGANRLRGLRRNALY